MISVYFLNSIFYSILQHAVYWKNEWGDFCPGTVQFYHSRISRLAGEHFNALPIYQYCPCRPLRLSNLRSAGPRLAKSFYIQFSRNYLYCAKYWEILSDTSYSLLSISKSSGSHKYSKQRSFEVYVLKSKFLFGNSIYPTSFQVAGEIKN